MKHLYYKLNENKEPVPCTLMEFAKFSEDFNKKVVKRTCLPGGVEVSTVFLGLDHSWGDEPPVLFETMIFGGEHDQYQERYHTWEQAVEGHEWAIELTFEVKQE